MIIKLHFKWLNLNKLHFQRRKIILLFHPQLWLAPLKELGIFFKLVQIIATKKTIHLQKLIQEENLRQRK